MHGRRNSSKEAFGSALSFLPCPPAALACGGELLGFLIREFLPCTCRRLLPLPSPVPQLENLCIVIRNDPNDDFSLNL
ncbi:hypothetical protein SLEP1_g48571 [Rubroshorea leprosula]|uniref:Secreted protein n=1 Tax=Rubroshorea leprosula TaxID=152421 RepID=A0AAV5LWX2_9ROSI|nr:hypothetical protein SLEP1_g48571 [Rubroshorea leprosula]